MLERGWIVVFPGLSGGVDRYARLDGSARLALLCNPDPRWRVGIS